MLLLYFVCSVVCLLLNILFCSTSLHPIFSPFTHYLPTHTILTSHTPYLPVFHSLSHTHTYTHSLPLPFSLLPDSHSIIITIIMTIQDGKLSDKPSSAASWSLGGEGKEKGGTANRYGRHGIMYHVISNTYCTYIVVEV